MKERERKENIGGGSIFETKKFVLQISASSPIFFSYHNPRKRKKNDTTERIEITMIRRRSTRKNRNKRRRFSRRNFIKTSALAGGGLLIGFNLVTACKEAAAPPVVRLVGQPRRPRRHLQERGRRRLRTMRTTATSTST